MNRRGESTVVAWVLMIALGVTLGILVSKWTFSQAEQSSQTIIDTAEDDSRCTEVNIAFNCEKLKNTGVFSVHGVRTISDKTNCKGDVKFNPKLDPGIEK